jgi:hypothetical protein
VFFLRLAFQLHLLLLLFRVSGLQPFRRHVGLSLAVGNGEQMPVAIAALLVHLRDSLAVTRHRATRFNE